MIIDESIPTTSLPILVKAINKSVVPNSIDIDIK